MLPNYSDDYNKAAGTNHQPEEGPAQLDAASPWMIAGFTLILLLFMAAMGSVIWIVFAP